MKKEIVILNAEDDLGHFIMLRNYLVKNGVQNEIIHLKDGRQTLDFLFGTGPEGRDRQKHYLLLLDIRMPKVDGIEILTAVRNDPDLKDLPVVIVTTSANDEDMEKCRQLGCNSYIIKPIKYTSYIEAIKNVGVFPSLTGGGVMLLKKDW